MSTLHLTLANLLLAARENPGKTAKVKLKRGLFIAVTVARDEQTFSLEIAREKDWPALTEWKTVCNHWPWHINAAPKFNENGRKSLRCSFPMQKMLL